VFRQIKTLAAAAFLCVSAVGLPVREEGSIDTMGSVMTVVAYGDTAEHVRASITRALDEANRLDAMLSNYKPHSEWSEMNRDAAERPVHISNELFALLTKCLEYSRESEGAFDISVGPLMKAWGFYKGSGHMPDHDELLTARRSVGYRNIILDPLAVTVRFAKKGIELDPGGIGKGYAVDRMIEILRSDGIRIALVSAGGSSIYALGAPPGEDGWAIKLPDRDPGRSATSGASVCLRDQSLSTSGGAEKFFIVDGTLWSHIMDPRTGTPARGMRSVSVIAKKTIDSEAWAKPYFILGRRWTAQHRKPGFRVFMCEDSAAAACTWME
jgi:FAD:protein FMN transferase